MEKLNDVVGNARLTLDKSDAIRAYLTMTDPDWKKWGFVELLEDLRLWIERNPLKSDNKDWRQPKKSQPKLFRREKSFSMRSKDQQWKHRLYIFTTRQVTISHLTALKSPLLKREGRF